MIPIIKVLALKDDNIQQSIFPFFFFRALKKGIVIKKAIKFPSLSKTFYEIGMNIFIFLYKNRFDIV